MGNDLLAFVVMVIVQLAFAGMIIITKLVMDGGMNPFVQSAYRPIFATISIAPFAFFLERKSRPKLTRSILFQIFLCSIFGITVNQYVYFIGLKNSTPTVVSAIDNLIPAFTFLIAVPMGAEKLGLRNIAGQAKLLGTIICVGGAMVLSLYHGKVVIGQLGFHWKYAESTGKDVNSSGHGNFFTGPFLVIMSSLTYAIWLIIQGKVNEKYAAPYTCITLMCLMASVESVIIGFCVVPKLSEWALNPIRAISVVYNGVVCTSFAYFLSSWCIERKGPLYVSMFNPLLLVISAFLSWTLLREKLYLGVVVGSIIIVVGLYGFLWGQKMETSTDDDIEVMINKEKNQSTKFDLELQLPQNPSFNGHPSAAKTEL
ncbi:PREDICTED: WAT1-related protein At1g09380-like [Nicotiana attenuata]|uniref:WAT1-related protein n=1 Tax=Nicotiana attenuata TaxID=49451 RepID=A0A1J6IS31_NICAT|nr:PREDICTED: WAT1-related protein At1g09380-like [Nicotiana attenuata]OIS97952.1 wat1-related protein [Nicotiana attenuata]